MKKNNYSSIETIINVAKKGGMYILVDDEKRENELRIQMQRILILWLNMEEVLFV